MILSNSEVAALREETANALEETCTIYRRGRVSDSAGGAVTAWVPVATELCRLTNPSGNRNGEQTQQGSVVLYRIVLGWETEVIAKDRINIGDRHFDVAAVGYAYPYMSSIAQCVEVKT